MSNSDDEILPDFDNPAIVPTTSIDWSRDDDWTDEEDDVDDYEEDNDDLAYEGDGVDDWGV